MISKFQGKPRNWRLIFSLLAAALLWFPGVALAQKADKETVKAPPSQPQTNPAQPQINPAQPQANPVGIGSDWKTKIDREKIATPQDPAQPEIDPVTKETVELVDAYFNNIVYLEGRFLQTGPDNAQTKGKFYVKRPGRLRFDYGAPSKLRIVADGRWLAIEDHDLKTFDRYPLESTPFRMLLKENVNLLEDAKIVDFFKGDDLIIITLADKKDETSGKIKLFFTLPELQPKETVPKLQSKEIVSKLQSKVAGPELQLKEWIITDPQGLDTRVEIANLEFGVETKSEFFDVSDATLSVFSE